MLIDIWTPWRGRSITTSKVTEVIKRFISKRALGMDEVRPEFFKYLDVVRLWGLWQTGVGRFKLQGTVLSLYRKVCLRVMEKRMPQHLNLCFKRNSVVLVLVVEQQIIFTLNIQFLRIRGSLNIKFACALWIWKKH